MLILSSDQVTYCKVMGITAEKSEILSGLSYKNKLFTRVKIYKEADQKAAVEYAKELTLDSKAQRLVLVVEERDIIGCSFVIWQENKEIKAKSLSDYLVDQIDLRKLVTRMLSNDGLEICDRQYHLKTYNQCFVGQDAVAWFQSKLGLTKTEALLLGQRLVDGRWIRHVVDEHDFKDEYLFYQLQWRDYPVENINLDQLIARMTSENGIDIRDRQYHLKTYPQCFIGRDLVQWFQRQFFLSEEDAIYLGQRLIKETKIHHVTFEHNFENEYLFYQFFPKKEHNLGSE